MQLNLLLTSDVHSYIAPTNYDRQTFDAPFGLERAATCLKNEQAKASNSLTFDDGDYLEGSPLSSYVVKHYNAPTPIDRAFDLIHYDYGIVGNHEFNYGQDYLKRSIKECKRPFLCANITDQDGNHPFGKPYAIRNVNGVKVGIIGFTTQGITKWELPKHIRGLQFHSVVASAKKYVPIVRKLADVVVVAYHGGFERDPQGHQTGTLDGENEGYQLTKQVKGIDAFLTGHQHRVIADHYFGVPVVQVGCKGEYVGKITLDLQHRKGQVKVTGNHVNLIPTAEYAPDKRMINVIKPVEKKVDDWLNTPLTQVKGSLHFSSAPEARIHKSSFIELIQKIQMTVAKADLSATSLFTDTAHGFYDPVTLRQIITNYIFPNRLTLSIITGADLKAAIEQSAKYFTYHDSKIRVNPQFKHQAFCYNMYEGVNYVINVAKPIGHRVVKLTYHDRSVDPKARFRIALNNYNAVGGGFYPMFHADQIVKLSRRPIYQIIADYLDQHQVIKATNNHNYRVIYKK